MKVVFLALVSIVVLQLSACSIKSERLPPAAANDSTTTSPNTFNVTVKTTPLPENKSTEPAPITPALAPKKLLGMTVDQITSLFGKPVFVRRDPPSEFWRYRSKSCVLELYFYRRERSQRVNHKEVLADQQPVANEQNCINALRSRTR